MLKYFHILEYFYANAWAMRPDKLSSICQFIATKASGLDISAEEIKAVVEAARPGRSQKAHGNVAVLPIMGVISHRANMVRDVSEPAGASTEAIGKNLDSLVSNPDVSTIILDIDSPGGTVSGVQELATQIFEARKQKHIIAVANAQAASAAFWIASAATELVVTPSGAVGSIGVFMVHQDLSERLKAQGVNTTLIKAGKFKAEGNPFMPLDEDALEAFQKSVDAHHNAFIKAVSKGRKTTLADVRNNFGQGRMIPADEAVKLGMADRVATLDETLAGLGVKQETKVKAQAEEDLTEIYAVSVDEPEGSFEAERRRREIEILERE